MRDFHDLEQEDMGQAGAFMFPGLSLRWYDKADSTNVLALNTPDLPEGTVIAADTQEAGRGRLGRTWQSPPGMNLYFSLVLYPLLPRRHWGGFSLAAGVGLARALAELELNPRLKWPNDVLLDGAKLAGILLESKDDRLVVGAGINVNQVEFPLELNAASVRLATGSKWRRDTLLPLFCSALYLSSKMWDQARFDSITSAWREYNTILGKQVTILRGTETIAGVAVDVDTHGALLVQGDDGNRHILHSGEVTIKKG